MALTYQNRSLLLYGGTPEGGEPANDLWRFDFTTRSFQLVAEGGAEEDRPQASEHPVLVAEQRSSGGVLAYSGALTRDDLYWRHDGETWRSQLESEPDGDWDGDRIPNVTDPDPSDYTFFFEGFSTLVETGDTWDEMKQALEDAGWHEETPCGGELFALDSWPPPSTAWHDWARLDGSAQLRKPACNPGTVSGPEVDVSALAGLPEQFGTLHFELTYKRAMSHPSQNLGVELVLVEDGQPRTVAVIPKGEDTAWQTLSVESIAESTVQVVLENHITIPSRKLYVNDARFTLRRVE